jgi:S1-C subfamily serine protease
MKRVILAITLILMVVGVSAAQSGSLTPRQIDELSQAVVYIEALDQSGSAYAFGSGTIVSANGIVYTNRHVVDGSSDLMIYLLDDPDELPIASYRASVISMFETVDFAILQIDRDASGRRIDPTSLKLPFVVPDENTNMARADKVFVFGYPGIGNGYFVLTEGNITTVQNDTVGGVRLPVIYQISAEIAPGNSGGMAVNGDGMFIGIPSGVFSEERTGGRLAGVIPIRAIRAAIAAGDVVENVEQGSTGNSGQQFSGPMGLSVDCTNGASFTNGVEVIVVQMRSGFSYTATAVGLDGFDPVLAVLDESGTGLCEDDTAGAANYTADLPTTGLVAASRLSSQVVFSHNRGSFANISLVAGGFEDSPGEFIVILEGMAVTNADGKGDPFAVRLTRGMIESGVPLTVYMIAVTNVLDPLMYIADQNMDPIVLEDTAFICDDAGSADTCFGYSVDLSRSLVSRTQNRRLPGGARDAMMSIPLEDFEPDTLLTFAMTSYRRETLGDYVVVFHFGSN